MPSAPTLPTHTPTIVRAVSRRRPRRPRYCGAPHSRPQKPMREPNVLLCCCHGLRSVFAGLLFPVRSYAYDRRRERQFFYDCRHRWHGDMRVHEDLALIGMVARPTVAVTKLMAQRQGISGSMMHGFQLFIRQHKNNTFCCWLSCSAPSSTSGSA